MTIAAFAEVEPMGTLCGFLGGIVVMLCAVWFTHVKTAVGRKEMRDTIGESESRYLSTLSATQQIMGAIQKDVQQLKIDVAVLAKNGKSHGQHIGS